MTCVLQIFNNLPILWQIGKFAAVEANIITVFMAVKFAKFVKSSKSQQKSKNIGRKYCKCPQFLLTFCSLLLKVYLPIITIVNCKNAGH